MTEIIFYTDYYPTCNSNISNIRYNYDNYDNKLILKTIIFKTYHINSNLATYYVGYSTSYDKRYATAIRN